MSLSELFAALTNGNMVITVMEDESELTRIYVSGYEQLQSSLLAKTVESITVVNQNAATVAVSST